MTQEYTRAYLQLIEEVAEDGELTHKEIYQLAKWLNDNKEGRKAWPANQFLPLLKSVFSDGSIDKAEALQVGNLIQKTRREWARDHAQNAAPDDDMIPGAVRKFDDTTPRLPSIETILQIESFNEADITYEVDLTGPSCSCPDFSTYRSALPSGHISRCCKHIMQAYAEVRPPDGWPSWLDPFFEAGFRPLPSQQWSVFKTPAGNYLVSSENRSWGNVYASSGGNNQKYGYNVDEDRWSYGNEPPEAEMLASGIRKLSKC